MDNYPGGGYSPQPENVWCPECGQVVPLKILAVHRNRLHGVPLPTPPPRASDAPDASVPMWISDKELPPRKPEPTATEAAHPGDSDTADQATDTDAEIPPHEHELPEHTHEEYKGLVQTHANEMTTIKLAIAQLAQKLQEKTTELATLQGLLDQVVKKHEVDELLTATPVALYDVDEKKIVQVSVLFKNRGTTVDQALKTVVDQWHKDGLAIDVSGLPPNMAVRVRGDTSERGFDLIPSNMVLIRLSKKDREAVQSLLSP